MVVKKTKKHLVRGKRTKKVCQKGSGKGKLGKPVRGQPSKVPNKKLPTLLRKTEPTLTPGKRIEPGDFIPLKSNNKVAFTQKVNNANYPEYPQKLNTRTKNGTKLETTKQKQISNMRNNFNNKATIRRIGFNDVLITPTNNLYKPYTVKIGKQFNKNFKSTLTNAIRESISNPQFVSSTMKPVSTLNLTIPINPKIAPEVYEMLRNGNNQNKIQQFIKQQREIGLPPNRPAPSRPPPPTYPQPPKYSPKPPPQSTKPPLVLFSQINNNDYTNYTNT